MDNDLGAKLAATFADDIASAEGTGLSEKLRALQVRYGIASPASDSGDQTVAQLLKFTP
jgi:hypothetical protein